MLALRIIGALSITFLAGTLFGSLFGGPDT